MKGLLNLVAVAGVVAFCLHATDTTLHSSDTDGSQSQSIMSDDTFRGALKLARIPPEFSEWYQAMLAKQILITSKEIYIGHWLPVSDRIAVSRLREEKKFFVFSTSARWFNEGPPTATIDTSEDLDLVLVSGDKVIFSGTPEAPPDHAVLFTEHHIYVVDLMTLSGFSYNRGYH